MAYLDNSGLSYFWQKIKAYVQNAVASAGNVPGGGSAGQVLAKHSATDNDTEWKTLTASDVNAIPAANGFFSAAECGLYSNNALHRTYTTGANNLRVDMRDDVDSGWSLVGYAALSAEASSNSSYRAANKVFATPNGSNGLPSMRKLVADDVTGLGDTAYGAGQSGISSAKAATSVAASTVVNLDTITLAAGTWLVTYAVEFASNSSGYRRMTLTTNATSVVSTPVYMESTPAANGFATNISKTQVIVATAQTTRYLNVYHTGSAALNCRSCIQAVRIA